MIEEIKAEYEEILKSLANPELMSDWEQFEELSKDKKTLEAILEKQKEIEETKKLIQENELMIASGEDGELSLLAKEEISQLIQRKQNLEQTLNRMIEERKSDAVSNGSTQRKYQQIIVEIRAGTGGDEAAIFAGDLFKMYSKYATKNNWKQKILDESPTELNGYKEIIFEIDGGSDKSVFSKLRYEAGVHRVQRIPKTEKQGRVHTSTATVAVLPKPKKTELKIRQDELRIDFFRSSGPGGQNVNKRETAVRITHLPTGIVVASQNERNQLQNKENAMSILEAKIIEKQQREAEEMFAGKRKEQIGKAQRVEKIRTYNFPQDRLTDHRIKKSFHNIEEIMEGKIDKLLESLEEIEKSETEI